MEIEKEISDEEEFDELELREIVMESLAAIERGDVISHEEVKRRLGYKDKEEWKEN